MKWKPNEEEKKYLNLVEKVGELETALKLNASMLAKQTDLAREAETRAMQAEASRRRLIEGIELFMKEPFIFSVVLSREDQTMMFTKIKVLVEALAAEQTDLAREAEMRVMEAEARCNRLIEAIERHEKTHIQDSDLYALAAEEKEKG